MVRIELRVTDELNNSYSMDNEVGLYPDLGNDFLDEFAREVNIFLRQCGYPSYNKDTVFLKSITDEELEELEDYLETIRNKGEA